MSDTPIEQQSAQFDKVTAELFEEQAKHEKEMELMYQVHAFCLYLPHNESKTLSQFRVEMRSIFGDELMNKFTFYIGRKYGVH